MAADNLSITLTELGNISERRIANLTDSTMSGLPPFLIESSGINSGFMIVHVAAASLASEIEHYPVLLLLKTYQLLLVRRIMPVWHLLQD